VLRIRDETLDIEERFMDKARVAINGFGRIGRLALRQGIDREDLEFVAVNDLVDADILAYLLKYDSAMGRFAGTVEKDGDTLVVNGKPIRVLGNRELSANPWRELEIDWVIESTGLFTDAARAKGHLDAGAKNVVLSAPGKGDVKTVVMGVNHHEYDASKHRIVSNASCTTNCLAPVTKVVLDNWGLESGLMTTIHAATASQKVVDAPAKKAYRDGRSVFGNIIPASTGAAKAVGLVLPETRGRLTGMAFRVPTMDVSVVDLTVRTEKPPSLSEINAAMKAASEGPMKGFLGYTEDAVVATDFLGDPRSSVYDATAGIELNDRFFKLISWYDNEMGYATRVVDLIQYMMKQ